MSNLVDYAKEELKRIGMIDSGDPYNDFATKSILDLIELFASQGHSNFTASYVAGMFHRLAMFKPASPLTGKDDEWNDIGDGGSLQNKRYSAVFKDKDGTAYNIEGKIFTDDGEVWYTCKDSIVNVTFPYVVPNEPEKVYRNSDCKEKVELARMLKEWKPRLSEDEDTMSKIATAFQFGMALGFAKKCDETDKRMDDWIPVSEGLPEENETVIASTKYCVYPEAKYTKECGWEWAYEAGSDYWKEIEDVTAWMPLPETYKAESEEKHDMIP